MAYDVEIADRIRELMEGEPDLVEKRLFGGIAFLLAGNMAVTASGKGGIMVRVDPAKSEQLMETTDARFMEMGGRTMRGWLHIDSADVRTKRQLTRWVTMGTKTARSLPPKR